LEYGFTEVLYYPRSDREDDTEREDEDEEKRLLKCDTSVFFPSVDKETDGE